MVRWACRADFLDCAFCWAFCWAFGPVPPLAGPLRDWPKVTGPLFAGPRTGASAAGLPAGVGGAVLAVEEAGAGGGFFAVRPDRRKARAGDDGESAGGSGISHAKAAGGMDDASVAGGAAALVPDDAEPDDTGLEAGVAAVVSPDSLAAVSAG